MVGAGGNYGNVGRCEGNEVSGAFSTFGGIVEGVELDDDGTKCELVVVHANRR